MENFPSSADFYSNTIFDIVLPGSRCSGMVRDDTLSPRQDISIFNQLRSGSRFLDLQIEASGGNRYNAYNGLSRADISSIIADIDTFITDYNYGPNEIILIYLSAFYGSNAELQGLYDIFTNSVLNSKMVRNSVDLSTKTLRSMIDDGTNIIAFSAELSTANPPNTFFDSNTFLHIPTTLPADIASNVTLGSMDHVHQVRTFVISNIRHGWASGVLNVIYWTLDTRPRTADYNSVFELKNTISRYSKLRFGNVLLVDYIASSEVVEQTIVLNYEYWKCHDLIWNDDSTGCPAQTSLPVYFKYDEISPLCTAPHSNVQTLCKRSCGLCPVSTDIPGSNCTLSSDCSSPLYAAYGTSHHSSAGKCLMRITKHSESQFIIAEPSFCLGLAPYESCGSGADYDRCGGNGSMEALVAQCSHFCSADYQCADGYCKSEWSICMAFNDEASTTAIPLDIFSNAQRYLKYASESSAQYRSDIDIFRPGDPDADYPSDDDFIQCTQYTVDCLWDTMNSDPYVTSILGFLFIIITVSISLCVCFTACCPCCCLCDRCCKKACCHACYSFIEINYILCCDGKPDPNTKYKRRNTCLCHLWIVTIVVCAFAIEGIIANNRLYSHVFDESDRDSFVSVSNRLFTAFDHKFGSVSNVTDFITNHIENTLDTATNGTRISYDGVHEMYRVLSRMASNYSDGVSLTGEHVMNPWTQNLTTSFKLRCRYCDTVYETLLSANATVKSESEDALNDIASIFDTESPLNNATDEIRNITNTLQRTIDKLLRQTNDTVRDTRIRYNDYVQKAKEYQSHGTTGVTALFALLIFIFTVLPILGMAKQSKWCFKLNWCFAMYASVVLFMIAVPFVFVLTLSADLCVRLDEFEDALPTANSRLGRAVFNHSDDALLTLMDTCLDGGSISYLFNLSTLSSYRQEMEHALHIDIAKAFTVRALETLQTEIDTLSADEFGIVVDEWIRTANAISECQCIDAGVPFDRTNLNPGTQCTSVGYSPSAAAVDYWSDSLWSERLNCLSAFTNASYAVQIENDTWLEAKQKIAVLQEDAHTVFAAYQSMADEANELIEKLQQIGCEVEPLFDQFDAVLDGFTNCGFIGAAYEDFKTVGCVTVFGDIYILARSLMIIASLCLLIVLCSLCLDYVYDPRDDIYAPINKAMTVNITPTVDTFDDTNAYNDIEMQSSEAHPISK